MITLHNFYKSKEWEVLLTRLKAERTDQSTGLLYCAHCGKPIIKAYDCIGHHKIELTSQNVNDYNISLNPDNIELVHHRCHNAIHERFGHERPQEVFLVYGPPCSGKSTWVRENAGKEDIIVDIDSIWQMISNNERYIKPKRLKANVFGVRDCLLDMVRTRTGKWKRAYIIGGYPMAMDRQRLCETLGCREIFIDTDKETCLLRAKAAELEGERIGWEKYIEDWFRDYGT